MPESRPTVWCPPEGFGSVSLHIPCFWCKPIAIHGSFCCASCQLTIRKQEFLAGHLNEFLPGLAGVLSFASLSVRPGLYDIYEDYVLPLPTLDLRSSVKALVLSLLPALEDETNEDYERAFRLLESLEQKFSPTAERTGSGSDVDGYFWQCLFLAVITSHSRRQGALNFLAQKLPKFIPSAPDANGSVSTKTKAHDSTLPSATQSILSPEPGLLVRCFAAGLRDLQVLVQRGFLDLLVSHIPLNSPILRRQVREDDFVRLVTAALHVLLRREMSLNRRLWSWFLGPETPTDANGLPNATDTDEKSTIESKSDRQYHYFNAHGRSVLEKCIKTMFDGSNLNPVERARPFQMCLSLMDRWEIGGSVVPHIFLPAMRNVYDYSLKASKTDTADVIKSASLFFDGVESVLIWANLLRLLRDNANPQEEADNLRMLLWIVRHFNVKDEEMLTTHVPYAAIYVLSLMLESRQPIEQDDIRFEIFGTLFELVPDRALRDTTSTSGMNPGLNHAAGTRDLCARIEKFYRSQQDTASEDDLLSASDMGALFPRLLVAFAKKTLSEERSGCICQTLSLLDNARRKLITLPTNITQDLMTSIIHHVETHPMMAFNDVSSIVSLLGGLSHDLRIDCETALTKIEPMLYSQLWSFLSPNRPKYHVEAVRATWQLHDASSFTGLTEASLTGFMRGNNVGTSQNRNHVDAVARFTVLWTHTVPTTAAPAGPSSTLKRRATSASLTDSKHAAERQSILIAPLMMALDTLNDPFSPAFDAVKAWICSVPSLNQILALHLDLLIETKKERTHEAHVEPGTATRAQKDQLRSVEYFVEHLSNILHCDNERIWQCICDADYTPPNEDPPAAALIVLAKLCVEFISDPSYVSPSLQQKSIAILQLALSRPSRTLLKPLKIDSGLLIYLTKSITEQRVEVHGPILAIITLALQLRLSDDDTDLSSNASRTSINLKRPSHADTSSPSNSTTQLTSQPPPQLLDCLKLAFSSPDSRQQLGRWLQFLEDVLPLFADAIFANVIPLVECLCAELDKIQTNLLSLSRTTNPESLSSPDSTSMILLEGLEQVIIRAHNRLITESTPEAETKVAPPQRGVFSNMTQSVFKTESAPSRTPQANSRLTVILAMEDAVRVSIKLWTWSNHYGGTDDFDKSSSASLAYNAQKIRNRTRHLLEQVFQVQPLEALEVAIYTWCYTDVAHQAAPVVDLLHVIQGLRPKTIVPTTLDALCSRTNPTALPSSRQSSLTLDLTPVDIVFFLQAYLRSVEDDAMDEIWPDIMAFLRDLLSNPLPYRQVLPGLLSIVLLLAKKVDNTNFGEQRKMRRDLGDSFQRLLTATFTALPSSAFADIVTGSNEDIDHANESSNSAMARATTSLTNVLKEVTANIDVILEAPDRATTAINTITASFIAPSLRSKSFPANISADLLKSLQNIAKKSPSGKPWKKEIFDAFNDPRLLSCSTQIMSNDWFPVFYQWILQDKERMSELISRLVAPSSAGIMFGVGASAARLDADRKAQLNLRRICLLLLASPKDTFIPHLREMWEKVVELLEASISSSPSAAVKSELFMLCRALTLSTSSVHLAPFWPVFNQSLQSALLSIPSGASTGEHFGNLALLQACKLLDLLIAFSPEEFQLHEWLFISDTIDAVYQPTDWTPSALSDQVAEQLTLDGSEEGVGVVAPTPVSAASAGRRRPLIETDSEADTGDYKAMDRGDFARLVLRPFLSQLSIHAYEGVYRMDPIDTEMWRRNLLQDVLDLRMIVE